MVHTAAHWIGRNSAPTLGSDEDVGNRLTFGLGLSVGEAIAPILIIETLERLSLIRRKYDLYREPLPDHQNMIWGDFVTQRPEPLPEVVYDLAFTSYGVQFMRACQGPVSSSPPACETSDVKPLG
jgi:hypothetical protein